VLRIEVLLEGVKPALREEEASGEVSVMSNNEMVRVKSNGPGETVLVPMIKLGASSLNALAGVLAVIETVSEEDRKQAVLFIQEKEEGGYRIGFAYSGVLPDSRADRVREAKEQILSKHGGSGSAVESLTECFRSLKLE